VRNNFSVEEVHGGNWLVHGFVSSILSEHQTQVLVSAYSSRNDVPPSLYC
jgi:hypothetical protein